MRTVFLAVFVLIAFTAVQANRRIQPAHITEALSRSKQTLQTKNLPKLAPVRFSMDQGKFAVRITFASCVDSKTLSTESFDYDPDFHTAATLTEIVKGVQYELTGTVHPNKGVTVPGDGLLYYLRLREDTVSFPRIADGEGVKNQEVTTIMNYFAGNSDFQTQIQPLKTNTPLSAHQGFLITFDALCVPAAVTRADKKKWATLFDKYLEITSASKTAYVESVQTTGTATNYQCVTGDCLQGSGNAQFEVYVATTAADDTIQLHAKRGLCTGLEGGVSLKATSPSVTVSLNSETCGAWSPYIGCTSSSCFKSSAEFQVSGQGQECRTRPSINGGVCKQTQQCRPCRTRPCDRLSSRPFSGETRNECFGCSSPGYKGWKTAAGCKCGLDCEKTGDCCQSWYQQGCATAGSASTYQLRDESGNLWTPVSCNPARCTSAEPYLDDLFPSYYCYCDNSCGTGVDVCCDGKANRDQICIAAPPAGAPGFR